MNTKKTLQALVIGALAAGATGAAANAMDASSVTKEGQEKCYGVVKAGHNDCGAADKSHACAGMAKEDANMNEWIFVPEGLCDKLAHGTMTSGGEHHGDEHHSEEHKH